MSVIPLELPVFTSGLACRTRNAEHWRNVDPKSGEEETGKREFSHWEQPNQTYNKMTDERQKEGPNSSSAHQKKVEYYSVAQPDAQARMLRTEQSMAERRESVSADGLTTRRMTSHSTTVHTSKRVTITGGQNEDNDMLPIMNHTPLDHSPQKGKGSLGKQGALNSRRPPSKSALKSSVITLFDETADAVSNGNDISTNGYHRREEIAENRELHTKMTMHEVHASSHSETHQSSGETKRIPHKHSVMVFPPEAMKAVKNATPGDAAWLQEIRQKKQQLRSNRMEQQITISSEAKPAKSPEWMSEAAKKKERNASIGNLEKSPTREAKAVIVNNSSFHEEKSSFNVHHGTDVKSTSSETIQRHSITTNGRSESPRHQSLRNPSPSTPPPPPPISQSPKTEHIRDRDTRTKRDVRFGSESHHRETISTSRQSRADMISHQKKETSKIEPGQPRTEIIRVDDKESVVDGHLIRRKTVVTLGSSSSSSISTSNSNSSFQTKSKTSSPPPPRKSENAAHRSNRDQVVVVVKGPTSSSQKSTYTETSQRNSHYSQKSEVRHHQERSESSQVTVNNRDNQALHLQEHYAIDKRKSWPLGVNNTDSLPPPPVWRETGERKSSNRNWDELDRGRIYVDPDPAPWIEEVTFSPPSRVHLHKSHHEKRETQTVNVRHFEQQNRHNSVPINLRPVKDEHRPSSPFQLHPPPPPSQSKKTPDWASEAENKRLSKVDWDKLERSGSPKTSKEPPWLNQVRLRHVSSESEVTADQRAAILREIQQFSPRRLRKRVTFAENVNIIARALSDHSDESAREELTPSPVRLEEHFTKEEPVRVVVNGRDHQSPKRNEAPKHDVAAYIRETVRERRQAAAYRAQETDEIDESPTWVEEAEIRQRNDIDWDNLEKKKSVPLSREPSWTLPRQRKALDSHIIQVRTWKDTGSVQGFERTQSLPSLTSEDDTACFWSRSIDWDSLDQKAWRSTDSFGPWIDEVQLKPTPSQESIEIETFTFPDVHLRRTPSLPRMEPDTFQLPDVQLRRTPSLPRLEPETFELPEIHLRRTPSMSKMEPDSFQLPEVTLRRTPSLPKLEPEPVQLPEVYLRRTPSLPKLQPDSFQLPDFRLRRTPSQMKLEPDSFQLPEVHLRRTPSLPKLEPESFELDHVELRRTPSLPRFEPDNFELPNIYLRKSPSLNNFQPEPFYLPPVRLNRTPSFSKFEPENFELPEVNLRRTPSLPKLEPESFRLLPVHLRRTPSLPRLEPEAFQVPKVYLRRTPSLPSLPIPSFELPDYRLRHTPITKRRYLRRLLNDDYEYSQREITFHDEDSLESLSSSESPPPWVHVAEERRHNMVDWDRLESRPDSRSNDCPWSDVNLRRTERDTEYEARQSKMSFSDEEEQTYWARTGSLPRPKPNEEARLARWTSASPTKAVSVESIATTDEDRLHVRPFDTLSRSFLKSRGPSWERLIEQNKNYSLKRRDTGTSRPRDVTSRPPWIRELKLRATPGVPTLDAYQSETPKLSMPEPSKPTPTPPSPPRQPERTSAFRASPKPKTTDTYYGRPNIEPSVLQSVQLKKASHLTKVRGPQVGKVLDEKKEPLKRNTSPEVSVSPFISTRDTTEVKTSAEERSQLSSTVSSTRTDSFLRDTTFDKAYNIRSASPYQNEPSRERTETKLNGYTSPFRAKSESEEEEQKQGYQYSVATNTTSRFMSQASPIRKYEKSVSVPKSSSYLSISKTNQENKAPVRKGSQDISVDEVLRSIRLIREASQSSPNLFANKKESFADGATRTFTVQQNSYKTMITTSYNHPNETLRSTRLSSPTEDFSKPQRRITSPLPDRKNSKEPMRTDTPDWLLELKKKKTRLSTAMTTATNRPQSSVVAEKLQETPRKYSAPERTTPNRTERSSPVNSRSNSPVERRSVSPPSSTSTSFGRPRTSPPPPPTLVSESKSPKTSFSSSKDSTKSDSSKNDFNSVIAQIKTINRDDLLVDMKTSQRCGSLRRRLFHDKTEPKSTPDKKRSQPASRQSPSPSGKDSSKDTSSPNKTKGTVVGRSCTERHAKTTRDSAIKSDEKGRKSPAKQSSPPKKERKKSPATSESTSPSPQRRQSPKPVTSKPTGKTSPGRTSNSSTTKQTPASKRTTSPDKQSESPKPSKSSLILNSSSSRGESESFINSFSSTSLSSFSTSTSTQNSLPKWQEYSIAGDKSFRTWRPPTPPSPRRFWEREDSPTQSPSPPVRRSPSPPLRLSPSPPLRRSPSPPLRRSPSPPLRRSPSPPLRYTPSPDIGDEKPRRFSQLLADLTSKKESSSNETETTSLKNETTQYISSKTSESLSRILSERKSTDANAKTSSSVRLSSSSPTGDREKHVRFSSDQKSETSKPTNIWNSEAKKESSPRIKSVKFRDEPETIGTSAYVITGEMEIEKKITTSMRTVTKSISQFS